jgi:hypothetical protein
VYTPSMNPTRTRRRFGYVWRVLLALTVAGQVATASRLYRLEKQLSRHTESCNAHQ